MPKGDLVVVVALREGRFDLGVKRLIFLTVNGAFGIYEGLLMLVNVASLLAGRLRTALVDTGKRVGIMAAKNF